MAPVTASRTTDDDRRAELLDRRNHRRGGRRLTDRRFDIVHGLPCQACDLGILTLADSQVTGTMLMLTYRCPTCGETRLLNLDAVGEPATWTHAYGPPTLAVSPASTAGTANKGPRPG